MSAAWPVGHFARRAVRAHRGSLVGSGLVVALSAGLLTMAGVWVETGMRHADEFAGAILMALASSFAGVAILIALFVVASTFSAALRPRAREFALLRAVGATVGQVRQSVTAEVMLVFAVAAPLGTVPGLVLAPRMGRMLVHAGMVPEGLGATLSPYPVVATLALLVPTALGAARLSGRESARLDPAGAIRSAAVESARLGRGRRVSAQVLAVAGLAVAGLPLFIPGTIGAAAASSGAIMLVIAASLVGPAILGWTAQRLLAMRRWGSTTTLALLNARGFSRRMTGAIVPLSLLLAVGAIQTGVSGTMADAAKAQVLESITADLVVRSALGEITGDDTAAVAGMPGVEATATTTTAPVLALIGQEDEDVPFLSELSWEPATIRTVLTEPGLLDPGVVDGSIDDLAGERTIAVSRDASFATAGLGDPVDIRTGDTQTRYTIVAIYERGLGLGDYLVGSGSADDIADGGSSLLLVQTADAAATRVAVEAAGLTATDVDAYAQEVGDGSAREQDVSTALVLALLALIAAMGANTLVMTIRSRRDELTLLRRTGATRRQVLVMVLAESALSTVTALAVGLACVLPGLVGAAWGLLGAPVPTVDLRVLGGLVCAVVLVGTALPVVTAIGATSARPR